VTDALAITMDLFPTVLAAAGVEPPEPRVLDGRNLLPVLTESAASSHDVIFGMAGARLVSIRDARWKLHVLAPPERSPLRAGEAWVDPRAPDGVTILAPFEQYGPAAYPGLQSGDAPKPMMLFDLVADPAEQHDLAADHPEVVARLKQRHEAMRTEQSASQPAGTRP
jgi:arylsulfatase A-like enzyme